MHIWAWNGVNTHHRLIETHFKQVVLLRPRREARSRPILPLRRRLPQLLKVPLRRRLCIHTPHHTLVVLLLRARLIVHLVLLIIDYHRPLILLFFIILLELVFIVLFSEGVLLRLEVEDFLDSFLQGHLLFAVEPGLFPWLICFFNLPFSQLNLLLDFAYIICHLLIGLFFSGVRLASNWMWELLFVEGHSIQVILTHVDIPGSFGWMHRLRLHVDVFLLYSGVCHFEQRESRRTGSMRRFCLLVAILCQLCCLVWGGSEGRHSLLLEDCF